MFEAESVDDSIQVVAVSGELDLSNAAELGRRVQAALRAGRNCVVVDLSGLTHMDSTGLAALISGHQLTQERGGRLALVVTSDSVRRTIEVRGLDRLFTLARTREDALTAVCD